MKKPGTPNERLDIFVKSINVTRTELAAKLGSSQPTISAILSGSRSLSRGMAARIGDHFPALNINWLLTGEGEMLKSESNAKLIGGIYPAGNKDEGVLMIDYIPVSATATFIDNLSNINGTYFEKYPLVPCGNEGAEASSLRIFEVDGDSMYPTIPSGALILVKEIPEKSWHYAEGVVVAVYDTFVVVKRILKNDLLLNNTLVLGSDNKDYGQVIVQQSDLRAIFKAKRIISSTIR